MADFDKFKQVLDDLGVPYDVQSMSSGDAAELASSHKEPVAAKSKKYILIGNASFHFDHFGRYLGLEATAFEPSTKEEKDGA